MSLPEQLVHLLNLHEEGVSDDALSTHIKFPSNHNHLILLIIIGEHFKDSYEALVPTINEMLQSNRLQLFMQGSNLIYKLIHGVTAAKFEGLGYVIYFFSKSIIPSLIVSPHFTSLHFCYII